MKQELSISLPKVFQRSPRPPDAFDCAQKGDKEDSNSRTTYM